MNLCKTEDQLNKKMQFIKKRNISSQNCLHMYRKNLVSLTVAFVNYMQKSIKILT